MDNHAQSFMKFLSRGFAVGLLAFVGACSSPPPAVTQRDLARGVPEVPGARSDGSVLLPNQWVLRPVGKQIALGDFPVNIAVTPDGRYAAVLHCGNGQHEVVVVDLKANDIVSRVSMNEAFYGLTFSANGQQLFCSGAGDEVVHRFDFAGGYLNNYRLIRLHEAKERGVPAGIAEKVRP